LAHIEVSFINRELINGVVTETDVPERKIVHDFRVFRGSKISFSSGFAFSYFGNDQSNYVKKQLPEIINPGLDTSQIIAERGSSFIPLFANMIHIQWRSANDIAFGGTFGIGVPLAGNKDVQYLLGISSIWGIKERFIFSAGAVGGRVHKLGGGYNVNDLIRSSDDIPIINDQFKVGLFISLSINIFGGK
jgi:hypothetical protein